MNSVRNHSLWRRVEKDQHLYMLPPWLHPASTFLLQWSHAKRWISCRSLINSHQSSMWLWVECICDAHIYLFLQNCAQCGFAIQGEDGIKQGNENLSQKNKILTSRDWFMFYRLSCKKILYLEHFDKNLWNTVEYRTECCAMPPSEEHVML